MEILALNRVAKPVLTVVGSKGKATTAMYAAATLAAHGIKVGLLTSPPIRENRERIRVDGVAIDGTAYRDLSRRLCTLLDRLPSDHDGYLSPSGLFTLMGVRHMLDEHCDAMVLEAGLGGRSDEVSLFSPQVVAIAPIFGEHLDVIGPSVRDVALDKSGVITPSTKCVFSVSQSANVEEVVVARALLTGSELEWVGTNDPMRGAVTNARGLSIANAQLGTRAAMCLAKLLELKRPSAGELRRVLATVATPGRLSVHVDSVGRSWIVDAAIDEIGARAALRYAEEHFGTPTTVFVSIPDMKDIDGVRKAVSSYPYVPVALAEEHLSFAGNAWDRVLVGVQDLERHVHGDRIVALGTWSFISHILEKLGAETDVAFRV